MTTSVTATAHTNIALIKYWGKENPLLNIPTTSSLSMTLDKFYTTTTVEFNNDISTDTLIVNEKEIDAARVHDFLNVLRGTIIDFPKVLIISENHVPTAAGLASSASSFAALTGAMAGLLEMNVTAEELSRLARRGSGSAARSIFGNFALWHKGEDDFTSYAESFLDEDIGLTMIACHVSSAAKKISSTEGMQLAQTSPAYGQWVLNSEKQLSEIKRAILASDIEKIGLIAENNALAMHDLNRTCRQPFDYFTDETRKLIDFAHTCYQSGLLVFATLDAGPNVKLITNYETEPLLVRKLQENFPALSFDICHCGPGVRLDA